MIKSTHQIRICAFAVFFASVQMVPSAMAKKRTATATCTNSAGDSAKIQSAVNTGGTVHIVGTCNLDRSVTLMTPGQHIHGDGRTVTVLNVKTILHTGAIVCDTGEPGPSIADIGITFAQNQAATDRSQLTDFGPAIFIPPGPSGTGNCSRLKMTRVRISNAMVGIDGRHGIAGAVFDDLELSALGTGIYIDNTYDSLKISNSHFYPFGPYGNLLPLGLQNIMYANNSGCTQATTSGADGAIGIYSARMDDLKIDNTLMLYGQSVCLVSGKNGSTFGEFSNVGFDSYGGISMAAGQLSISSSYFSLAKASYSAIILSGGNLQCSSCNFQQGNSYVAYNSVINMTGGALSLYNSYMNSGEADVVFFNDTISGNVTINGLQLFSSAPIQSNPKIIVSGKSTTAHISGVFPLNSVKSATLIAIATDNYHRILGNGLNSGWSNFCVTPIKGIYANNGTSSFKTCN